MFNPKIQFLCALLTGVLSITHCDGGETPTSPGLAIAAGHSVVFTKPPSKIPSDCSPDAPLLGNGDVRVAIGGNPELLQFYITKADLWEMHTDGGPRALARMDLGIPSLKGASYLIKQNISEGITTGEFKVGDATLAMETAVAATENTMWLNLTAQGGTFSGSAALVLPASPAISSVRPGFAGGVPVQVGCEGFQGGRWYLNGDLDELTVHDRALSPEEIAGLANRGTPPSDGLVRAWKFNGVSEFDKAHGTAAYEPGPVGQALICNGVDTSIASQPFPPTKAVTVSAFIKIAAHSSPGNAEYILSQGEWDKEFSLGLSSGAVRMAVNGEWAQSDPIPTGKWVHVAGTFDGRIIRVYVDGKEAARKDLSGGGSWESGVQVIERRFENGMIRPSGAACAMRVLGGSDGSFTVAPGHPVCLLVTASGLENTTDYRADAVKRSAQATPRGLEDLARDHRQWWANFWSKSFIEIPDKILEARYYLSNYCLGSASRLPHFPPGLFGWNTGDSQMWGGAYFMNYNFFAPFYGLYSGNHLEQSNPCNVPVLDFLESGREWCRKECHLDEGVLFPVSILPYGITGAPVTWLQRSDASYACVPLASTWYATYDLEFARKAYPFVKEVAIFWEKWLVFENGRYVDRHDAVLEEYARPPVQSQDVNPIVALAFIRQVMDLAIDMGTGLGVDSDRHAKWADIRDHISDYPVCTVADLPAGSAIALPRTPETLALPIFRYTEQGTAWQNTNAVGIQHIFPGNGIGLDSKPELLERARNQIAVMGRWIDFNGCNSFYPAAARVGYDPDTILKNLRHWVETASPNGMRADNPSGMEQLSTVPCTLQEMLFQSYDGIFRFFPCWPKNQDARFGTLRARGAFLVSAEFKGGVVGNVRITSEKGRNCSMVNPWPNHKVRLLRDGKEAETLEGNRLGFATKPGEIIEAKPL